MRSAGWKSPTLLEESTEKVENSRGFNPENGAQLTEPRPFNLMFKTYVGPTATEADVAYLRPETAQAIFAQFKNVLDSSRNKVPFGICQIGKAFRNEVTPRNFTFRSREFEQMELEFFIAPDEAIRLLHGSVAPWSESADLSTPQPNWGWEMWHRYWVAQRTAYYHGIGLGPDVLDYHWQTPEELAHYARACVDILFKFPFGTDELEGIAARGDFDLSQHQKHSGKPQEVFDEDLRTAAGKLDDASKAAFIEEVADAWAARASEIAERKNDDAEDAECRAKRGQGILREALQGPVRASRHRTLRGPGPPDAGHSGRRVSRGRKAGCEWQAGKAHPAAVSSSSGAHQNRRLSAAEKQAGPSRQGARGL